MKSCAAMVVSPMVVFLTLAGLVLVPASAATENNAAAASAQGRTARYHGGSSLDGRIRTLSKALDLDVRQQAELRKILIDQRDQVRKVWDDQSLLAAYRVSATQTISERTSDRIRSILTDEQKKKYNPPKPQDQAENPRPDVEVWMNAAQRNQAEALPVREEKE
jgi:hypothetical protein